MDDLPAPLARDLVSVDHDSMDLRIEPVFESFPRWMGWLPALALLPFTAFLHTATFIGPEVEAIIGSVSLLQCALVAFGAYITWNHRPPLRLSLGVHRLELRSGRRIESIALPDLQKVTVTSRKLSFQLRDGRKITLRLPDRSRATGRALDGLLQRALERGRTGAGEVPEALSRLVGTQRRQAEGM
jgi:hypothetical protein